MRIEIVGRDIPSSTLSVRDHVNRKLARLSWNARDIVYVRVTLGHRPGPRGGLHYSCKITVAMVELSPVEVMFVDRNLYEAISQSSARTERRVRDALANRRRTRRSRGLAVMWG